MCFVDMHDSNRVNREPNQREVLFTSGRFEERGFVILHIELRLYEERIDERYGTYSLITSFMKTDRGSIEMIYDEGFRGEDALSRTAMFVVSNIGLSGLILRSIITLKGHLERRDATDIGSKQT